MPLIRIETIINASVEICFDLSRSIDLHKLSTAQTNEKAIAGVTSGLIGMNETVAWKARHFGINQKLTTVITEFEKPNFFVDEMKKGAFKRFCHMHKFIPMDSHTKMIDEFDYDSPFGIVGRIFDRIVLKDYMENLLHKRNSVIKDFAETEKWKTVLLNN